MVLVRKHTGWTWEGPRESTSHYACARYMGFPESLLEKTHDAMIDVDITTKIIVKLINMQRWMTSVKPGSDPPVRRLEMKGAFK